MDKEKLKKAYQEFYKKVNRLDLKKRKIKKYKKKYKNPKIFWQKLKPSKKEINIGYMYRGGYKFVYRPKSKYSYPNGWIALHRLKVMEELGRRLKSNEHVHHINFDTKDNRIENLKVMDKKDHMALHGKIDKKTVIHIEASDWDVSQRIKYSPFNNK